MTKAASTVSTRAEPQFKILFEDNHLIVLSKPAGLLSQGEHRGDDNLVDRLRVHFGRNYVGLVHRLDRNTSGLMVVAKRTKAAQRLTEALQSGKLQRTYRAWIWGSLDKSQRWEHRLEKDVRTNTVRVIKKAGRAGKASALQVVPIRHSQWKGQACTLAEFTLETGRSHQIRVQSSYEGFPLLGDMKYGGPRSKNLPAFPRMALHSFRLVFPHPMSEELLQFEEKLPQELDF